MFELSYAFCVFFFAMPQMPHENCCTIFLVTFGIRPVLMTSVDTSFIPISLTKEMLEAKKVEENTLVADMFGT